MSNKFTEVTQTSGLSNIGGSFKGVVFGIILILVSIVILWKNEGRAVHTAEALNEGADNVIKASADRVDPNNEGKLVHVSALATTKDTLKDHDFDIKVNAIKLIRNVEIYQWVEKTESRSEQKLGGGTETTTEYSYAQEWVSEPLNSSKYKISEGHINIAPYNYTDKSILSKNVTFGAYTLSDDLIGMLSRNEDYSIQNIDTSQYKEAITNAGKIYVGSKNNVNPAIGDVRISYEVCYPGKVSIVGKQIGDSFEEYIASNDETVLLLREGVVSAENMFKTAIAGNSFMTWVLRLVGFILMFIGFRLILGPLVAVGNVVPVIGSLISMGTGIVSLVVALPISLLIIAIAWFAYRPFLSITLIAVGLGIYFYYKSKGKKKFVSPEGVTPVSNGGTVPESYKMTNPQITPKSSNPPEVVYITLDKLKASKESYYYFMLTDALKKEGIEIFRAQDQFSSSHFDRYPIDQIKSYLKFSQDAIEFLRPNIMRVMELKTRNELFKTNNIAEKELLYIVFEDRTTLETTNEFKKVVI